VTVFSQAQSNWFRVWTEPPLFRRRPGCYAAGVHRV